MRLVVAAVTLLLLAVSVDAKPSMCQKPIMAQVRFNIQPQIFVRVKHDARHKHHVSEVFATNRPDVFKLGRRYKLVFTYKDRSGRIKVRTITRRVLDAPKKIGGKPNLELCLYAGDKDVINFVRSYLNGRTVKAFAV